MEFGTFSFTILGKYKKVLDPQKHTLTIFGGYKRFLDPPKTHTLTILGGYKKVLDPPTHTLVNFHGIWHFQFYNFGGYKKVFRLPKNMDTLTIFRGGYKKF